MFALLVLALTAIGVFLTLKGTLAGIILVGIAFLMFGLGLRNIPANPPHKGLVTIWGKRYPSIIGEGYTVLAPYFPFFYDVIPINMEQHNEDYVFEHLRCNAVAGRDFQSGAAVTVKVGVTWSPNDAPQALFNFIGVGTESGTRNIMRDMLAEALRQYATTKTWEELTRSGGDITQILLQKLTAETASGAEGQQRLYNKAIPMSSA
jgi:regulator of protease activity HflC (stomatin/prohibitin superfamily)